MNWTGLDVFLWLSELGALSFSGYVTLRFHQSIVSAISASPRLSALDTSLSDLPSVSVIIPAYNEEINIRDCAVSVLQSNLPSPQQFKVWIADDESTDGTRQIAQELVAQDSRVQLLAVPPRPTNETWFGKNWACTQAAALAQEEYLLFIDADVRLDAEAIAVALTHAKKYETDLLSAMPKVICGCLSEWLAQPIIFRMLIGGFDPEGVNDPNQKKAFAAGPFMLFRRQAYEQIGGHRSVADDLVEDVALARRIKAAGLKMRLAIGFDFVQVRMYQNFAGLWEGWTKNFHLGAQRRISGTLMVPLIALSSLTLPWLVLSLSVIGLLFGSRWQGIPLIISLALLIWEWRLWQQQAKLLQQPVRYWGLSWLGGLLVSAIAIGSIIKTETGWGWTWRGRSLATQHGKTNPSA
jgi:cellulose synthase/poly-beta-1,6-N-acetylglucosamine synthase-like glycosyltransferase